VAEAAGSTNGTADGATAAGTPEGADHVVRERLTPEITLLRLNRPERLNALSFGLMAALHRRLDEIQADNACRVVILTGAGRGFCAGLDLKDLGRSPVTEGLPRGPRAGLLGQAYASSLISHVYRLQQPVIAAVNGPAFGGGLALSLACDLRVAVESARFCVQFIKVGVTGCDFGVSYLLPRLVGASRAFDLMLTGREFGAAEAERIGLLSRIAPGGKALDVAVEIAEAICAHTPFGVVATKEVMHANLDAPSLDVAMKLEDRNQILASQSGDIDEAMAAFAEKRAPRWRA
jgi:enoyl-CoA hydratase/carnithine racemase